MQDCRVKYWAWMFGAMLLAVAACHSQRHVRRTDEAIHGTVAPSEQSSPKPNSNPTAKTRTEAIAAALEYLQHAHWEFDFVYLYSYLQPKFQWPDVPAQAENGRVAKQFRINGDAASLRIEDQMRLFTRLLEPSFILPRANFETAQEEDAFTIPALYCDIYPIDTSRYFPVLRQEIASGDYRLTHALLAYIWISERQCLSIAELKSIKMSLLEGNHALVDRFPMWLDLKMEAAGLLQAAGEMIPPNWIEEVIAAQQPDGGWLDIPQHTSSSTHTTILAVWLLAGSGN